MNSGLKELSVLEYKDAYKLGVMNVGGKAFSIARLYINEIKVPNGVILPYQNWECLKQCSNKKDITIMVNQITKKLKCNRYAVRSSAIGEDSSKYSWAGCFESILNVKESELEDAIWKCGKSMEGKRVEAYRELHRDIPKIKYMGILIQEYIEADWSGVCFSINPITKNKNEVIIECQNGKSGSVVGGYGDPITVSINKNIDYKNKNYEIPDYVVNLVMKNVNIITNIWNCAVDIEWVIKDKEILITQTRPITTL